MLSSYLRIITDTTKHFLIWNGQGLNSGFPVHCTWAVSALSRLLRPPARYNGQKRFHVPVSAIFKWNTTGNLQLTCFHMNNLQGKEQVFKTNTYIISSLLWKCSRYSEQKGRKDGPVDWQRWIIPISKGAKNVILPQSHLYTLATLSPKTEYW